MAVGVSAGGGVSSDYMGGYPQVTDSVLADGCSAVVRKEDLWRSGSANSFFGGC